jgi:NmrA-like family
MTTLKKLVVIFTATGSQGFAITKHLATDPIARSRYTLRALTRDPSKPQAKELANLGVEVVECSLDSDESVSNAVSGAWAIFANSDFWSVFTVEAEVIQGRRMLAAASKLPNLEIFIQSSFPDARVVSNGKNQGVLHYNAKNEINAVSRTEYPSLWAKTTIIWVAYYYQNWLKFNYPFGPHKTTDSSGKVSYAQRMTYPPDTIIPSFFPGDLGPVIATILQGGGLYHGKTIACVAEKQTDSERLRIWADSK